MDDYGATGKHCDCGRDIRYLDKFCPSCGKPNGIDWDKGGTGRIIPPSEMIDMAAKIFEQNQKALRTYDPRLGAK